MMTVTVLTTGLRTPGGPAFDAAGRLWCAETTGRALVCRQPDGRLDRLPVPGQPHTVGFDDRDQLWFSDREQQALYRRTTPADEPLSALRQIGNQPLNQPADLLTDLLGNVLLACPGRYSDEETSYVLALTPDGLSQIIADGLAWPLALALTPDGHTLLIAETYRQRIWSGRWDGEYVGWENIWVWASLPDAPTDETMPGPAAMAIGPDGRVYLVEAGQPFLRIFSPDGVVEQAIELPDCQPTGCCYDPKDQLGLIVTDAANGALLSCTW
jgi:gluconolactonase